MGAVTAPGRGVGSAAGIGAVTALGLGAGSATAGAGSSSQKAWKLSASRSASSTLNGADDGRPLSAESGINCDSEASIAHHSGATRGAAGLADSARARYEQAQAAC